MSADTWNLVAALAPPLLMSLVVLAWHLIDHASDRKVKRERAAGDLNLQHWEWMTDDDRQWFRDHFVDGPDNYGTWNIRTDETRDA